MMTVRSVLAAGCGLALLLTIGCGPSPKDMQIQELQDQVNRLTAERDNLAGQLARAMAENDQLRARLGDMQRQLAAAMEAPPTPRGMFTEAGPFAWTSISEDILFDSGKADLKTTGRAALEDVVGQIRAQYPDRTVFIIGHTDTDPIKHSKWKDNLELSVQRGATVFREMQRMGLDPERLVAAGQGQYNPTAENATAAGKRQNRRVQVVAVQVPESMNAPAAPEPETAG